MAIESSQHRYLSSGKLWVLSKAVFIFLNHALCASLSHNTTEAVLQTQKQKGPFRFLPTGVFGITFGGGPLISVEIRRSIFDKPVLCPN